VRTFSTVWTKLRETGAAYRRAFVASELKRLIPFQIYALRKKRGWSQEELAKRSNLTQGVISRAEDPDYGNMTFNTVISIAGGFDIAFVGKFVPFSELDDYFVGLSEDSAGSVPSFAEEDQISEQLAAEREALMTPLEAPPQHPAIIASERKQDEQKVVVFNKIYANVGQPKPQSPMKAITGELAHAALGGNTR
jgi:transcriptional regulator with XRE-family HTH domain